ncbi:TPA: hypothetical protein ACG4NT_002787 [Stenotrophomonas maltophilia]
MSLVNCVLLAFKVPPAFALSAKERPLIWLSFAVIEARGRSGECRCEESVMPPRTVELSRMALLYATWLGLVEALLSVAPYSWMLDG